MKPGLKLLHVLVSCKVLTNDLGSIGFCTPSGQGKEVNNTSYGTQDSNKLSFAAQGKQSFS